LNPAGRSFALATLLAAGCSAWAPSGLLPARIEFFQANAATCGQPDSGPICEARVNHVEGKPVLTLSSYAEIEPGRHVLGLFCRMNLSIMIGDSQSHQREVEVALAPGGRYRVEARMAPRPCTMTLVDEATGKAVGKVR
jgi:hypothetical protein